MGKNYGVIDIGTVKVKFLIASLAENGTPIKKYASSTLTCFGCDMVDDNVLDKNLDRTIAELKVCREKLTEFNAVSCRVVSTHAMRRAKNKDAVTARIKRETGFEVENLTSEQEAELFFRSVLRDFPANRRYVLVDVGGGSIQVIIGQQGKMEQTFLLPIGAATLHEKFTRDSQLETSFNTPEDIDRMKEYILEQLMPIPASEGLPIIYGSTNIIDMMQAINLPLDAHADSPTHPYKTYATHLEKFIGIILPLTFAEREAQYPFQKGYMWGIDKAFVDVTTLARRLNSPYIIPTNANLAEGLIHSMVA